ncbi:hypothetical protein EPJ74_06015 [Brachyspira aalborgi]|uniref:AlgX/AlgJ SGNH hydrolase-like domain-containing protein n=1 Tax=Brachyspira aalborgi TaxID=29522 RepID=A0A5C8GFT4_9SPIR|nr:hypothetical protein [Brachyspira aalborgi]TXJ60752.1 hypothetical protein EPJ74_06015 [Brachyspira aalborgi]
MRKIIYLGLSFLLLATLITFHILGSKERVGYLSDFEIIEGNKSNYIYNFRIRYYDKVFRNSDIYGVYLITNSLPEYIKEIKMNELGSPFGIIISDKIIEEEKIDNIKYILRLKNRFILFSITIILLFLFVLKYIENVKIFIFNLFVYIKPFIFDFFAVFSEIFIRILKSINFKNKFAIILILFLCFLIMPNIIYRIFYKNFDHTNYENRTLASKPILVSTNINEYPKRYEEYFNDYLPFRNELVKLKNLNDIFIFKNIFSRRVLLGKNKWLFNNDDNLTEKYMGIERYYFTKEELEIAKNNLIHFRDELKKKNIDFILMVCPSKYFIYSEYMPDYIKRKSTKNDTDIFVEYIKNNTDIKVVYPKEELLKYKDKYQLYYKYDAHWNTLGAYIEYTQLMKSLNLYIDNIDNVDIKDFDGNQSYNLGIYNYNDLACLLSLNSLKYYNDDKTYIISNYIIKNYDTNYFISWNNFSFNSKLYNNKSNIMIIIDSFGLNMIDYIATGFKQSEFIGIGSFKNENITEYKPDIVVFQSVERYLKDRMLNTMPNYRIEEINED